MDVTFIRPRLYPEDFDIDLACSDVLGFSSYHLRIEPRIGRLKRNVFPVLNAKKPAPTFFELLEGFICSKLGELLQRLKQLVYGDL